MSKLSYSLAFVAALFVTETAIASDLNVKVVSGGNATVKVVPGGTVNYEVIGELSDALNSGLSYVTFDLEFNGGALSQANAPTANPMLNFATPAGINNPAGFGGTVLGNKLIQVGGAQNTINNLFAPFPQGTVIVDVAKPGSPATLATGSLIAPSQVGTYKLKVGNVDANVIRQGETGLPFWKVDQAGAGTLTELTVQVSAISANITTLSISNPGSQVISLTAGTPWANRTYWTLGSFSGTAPGLMLGNGIKLPLNFDSYFQFLLNTPNPAVLSNSVGILDAQGNATATFNLPPSLRPAFAGRTIHHAYILQPTMDFASDAVSVTLVP
jgi:hypothetical protein